MYAFLDAYKGFWVSFNGQHYDNIVLAYGQMNRWFPHLNMDDCCDRLKEFSDKIIRSNDDTFHVEFRKYKNYFKFVDIDLYLYWSKLLRQSKKISLKGLGIQLGYHTIQELPYHPDKILTDSEWEEIIDYNLNNDLGILDLLARHMKEEILLRQQINKQTKLNSWSWDAPKIASELLLKAKCDKTQEDPRSVRALRYDRIPVILGTLFSDVKFEFETPIFQSMFEDLCKANTEFSKTFIVPQKKGAIKISMGVRRNTFCQ